MRSSVRRIPGPAQARRQLRTVRDLWRYACTRLSAAGLHHGHGAADASDEAAWLVLWSLHLPPEPLEPWLDARLATAEIDAIIALVERRCRSRLPLPYLIGEAWLRGVRFRCDPRALVPRSPIAEALEEALPEWIAMMDLPETWPGSILDLCTGGGSLAVLAALAFPLAQVDAADLSADALALAAENLADHGLAERIRLHQGDLFAPLAARRFDLILCNPPYVDAPAMATLPPEYRAEPRDALAAGDDGMDLVRRIVAAAPRHLADDGVLVLEIGHGAASFEQAFPQLEFGWLPVTAGDCMLVIATREQLAAAQ